MPDVTISPVAWRTAALQGLGQYLQDNQAARPLTASELARYAGRSATHGWRLPPSGDGAASLDVLVDSNFPYAVPRVAVAEGLGPLDVPHIESDGVLCVLPGAATFSTRDPVGVAKSVIDDAYQLLGDCREGGLDEDFRTEFLSYWSIAAGKDAPVYVSMLTPQGPSRRIAAWHGTTFGLCAEDRATLDGWLARSEVKKPEGGFTFYDAVLVWLPQPMRPAEYPRTAADLLSLVRSAVPDAAELFTSAMVAGKAGLDVIIGAPTAHGACFAAMTLQRPEQNALTHGFRSGHTPKNIFIGRFIGASKATRAEVRRADHGWVHGRDQDPQQAVLKNARVLLLGCGAVGAGLARLLAQSGVGHLTLVDHQKLDWPNISRHALGASAVTRYKAVALAEALKRDFPHLPGIEVRPGPFGLWSSNLLAELPTFDLIISATGEWAVDALLTDLRGSRRDMPPVIYAWLEAEAVAAHALYIPNGDGGGCLRCGFNDRGVPMLPVAVWPHGERLLQEPACGAVFSPFGAAQLTWAHALTCEMVLDVLTGRVNDATLGTWIGRRQVVEAIGGAWNPAWIEVFGNPGDGGLVARRHWPTSPDCPMCSKAAA